LRSQILKSQGRKKRKEEMREMLDEVEPRGLRERMLRVSAKL